jgi:branched-chain amino acid transport system substrate-binding protein
LEADDCHHDVHRQQSRRLYKLKGQKIALGCLDSAYGKEPFPVLDEMAKRYGMEWKGYPTAAAAMVEQSSTWLQIRRDKPD